MTFILVNTVIHLFYHIFFPSGTFFTELCGAVLTCF